MEAQISEPLTQIRRQKHEILSKTNQSQTLEEQGEGNHKGRWNKNKRLSANPGRSQNPF